MGYLDCAGLEHLWGKIKSALDRLALLPEMSRLLRAYGTLGVAGWTGSAGAWSQALAVEGVTAEDVPHVYPLFSADGAVDGQRAAWNSLEEYADSAAGTVMCYCAQAQAPGVDLPVMVEVLR